MNFISTYRSMNATVTPSPALIEKTLSRTARRQPSRYRCAAAIAAVLAVCLTVPALAAWTEPGYQLLYAVSPAAAQFFQPVRLFSVSGGVTMEVLAVRVENDTAQTCITLSGEAVDETCDLYDSASFHVPFDQSSRCERIGYDADTNTAAFLVTTQTMDGSPIPGGKMTFSVGCFLSGKEKAENLAIPLDLASLAVQAETTDAYSSSGSSSGIPMLLPGAALAVPVEGISLSAAGYADGFFQVQAVCRDNLRADNHCRLWLEDSGGNRLDAAYTAHFSNFSSGPDRLDFTQFAFDITPEALAACTLRGDFWTSANYTEGRWQVTFPLKNTHAAEK